MTAAKKKNTGSGESSQNWSTWLWVATVILALGLLFVRAIFPEFPWLSVLLGLALIGCLGYLLFLNRKALRTRTAAYGLNSVVTVLLVIALVGVLNFLVSRYPLKADLTRNKLHTLSDQTTKLVKGLGKPVKATVFAKAGQREQVRPLLDNYKGLNPKFEVEYVDPDREPTRAKTLGIRKLGTIHLAVGPRDSKIEDVTEEKLTNALIKLLKEKTPTVCSVTGHGEKSLASNEADGYESVRKQLQDQAYETKDINLVQEGKIPESCDGLLILGPTKSFFEPEVKILNAYLANGGRAVIAADVNIKGGDYAPELAGVLAPWHVKPQSALIVDPTSRLFNLDASIALLVGYSKEHAVTKDFQINSAFPFARPLEIVPGAPAGMNVTWLGQTTPRSWGETDLKAIGTGRVEFNAGTDKAGPLNVAVAVEGKLKDSKASRNTRLVVYGSSAFAANNFSRFGGNLDFFLNGVSWILEDESLISIRAKEEGPGKLEMSAKQGTFILLLTIVIIPLLVAGGGIFFWWYRRRF